MINKGRCLIPITSFFEFTTEEGASKRQPKSKWRFTMRGLDWFSVAGIWRKHEIAGEAWTMLTTEPGPDIAPYHNRQIVLLRREQWGGWIDGSASTAELCCPLPAGSLDVEQVR